MEFTDFSNRVNIIEALDHSSRAGNYFFQSIFDTHPEVLTCPWIQYTYSYFVTKFGMESEVDAKEAHQYWSETSYFRLVYQELPKVEKTIISFGSDPSAEIDRPLVRKIFDEIVLQKPIISRRELILASFYAYARGCGKSLADIKYILISDAVTLRFESPVTGFSGRILNCLKEDFPDFKLVFLERDPRATFASCRQQYTNSNGNTYSLGCSTLLKRFLEFFRSDFHTEGCVWLYWLLYQGGAAKIAYQMKERWLAHTIIVKNEDLNLDFKNTITKVANHFSIKFAPEWGNEPFEPTNVGKLWLGKGAYNNRYLKAKVPILENDPDQIAHKITGPNKYVTERWKTRLNKAEMGVLEYLFRDEINELGYPYLTKPLALQSISSFLLDLIKPFSGEVPGLKWAIASCRSGIRSCLDCILYYLSLPLFYVTARITLLRFVFFKKFFRLRHGDT